MSVKTADIKSSPVEPVRAGEIISVSRPNCSLPHSGGRGTLTIFPTPRCSRPVPGKSGVDGSTRGLRHPLQRSPGCHFRDAHRNRQWQPAGVRAPHGHVRSDRNLIEKAEAHRRTRLSMMSRRPHGQNAFCASPPSTASTAAQTAPQLRNRALPVPGDMTVSASIGRSPVSGTAPNSASTWSRGCALAIWSMVAFSAQRRSSAANSPADRAVRIAFRRGGCSGCIGPVHVQNCPHGYRELTPSYPPLFRSPAKEFISSVGLTKQVGVLRKAASSAP